MKIKLITANPVGYLIRAGTHDPRAKGIKIPTAEQVCRVLETLYSERQKTPAACPWG